MAKGVNQKQKILYLRQILLERTDEKHPISMAEILEALEAYGIQAERKSIYADIETLKNFGMDIIHRREQPSGYCVVSREFELPELKLLVDAVHGSKFIIRKKSEALIRKIEGLVSIYEAKKLARNVHVANRIKTMNESIYYTVDDIHSAINGDRQISFQHFKWNEKGEKQLKRDGKVYKVSPWALTWDDENYYLVAFDAEEGIIKHYRVDKMLKMEVLDERREGAEHFKNFDMALYSKKTFGMYSGKDEHVTLRGRNQMADPIIDRFGQTDFDEIMGYYIAETEMTIRNINDVLAQIIYEMTFFGYSQEDIEKGRLELEEAAKEADKGKTIPAEKLFADLGIEPQPCEEEDIEMLRKIYSLENEYNQYWLRKEVEKVRRQLNKKL